MLGGRDHELRREQRIEGTVEQVFAPFADAGNLETLTPPWLRFRIITELPIEMCKDAQIEYRLRLHGVPVRWRSRIETWKPPRSFTDVQESGPFALWHHTHTFEPDDEGVVIARDVIRYRVGYGAFGELALRLFVARDLERIFDYRREAIGALTESSAAR